nr:hypothetical protein PJ912_08360 [Pectobacterium colocasium]
MLTQTLEPLLMMVVGGMVGALVVGMYLPIFPVGKRIGRSLNRPIQHQKATSYTVPATVSGRKTARNCSSYPLKIRFSCSATRINVVRFVNSFKRDAPT